MKLIDLTNSELKAIVDDEDYNLVLSHSKEWFFLESGGAYCRSKRLASKTELGMWRKLSMPRIILNEVNPNGKICGTICTIKCCLNIKKEMRECYEPDYIDNGIAETTTNVSV
jgi:hypothetical protein